MTAALHSNALQQVESLKALPMSPEVYNHTLRRREHRRCFAFLYVQLFLLLRIDRSSSVSTRRETPVSLVKRGLQMDRLRARVRVRALKGSRSSKSSGSGDGQHRLTPFPTRPPNFVSPAPTGSRTTDDSYNRHSKRGKSKGAFWHSAKYKKGSPKAKLKSKVSAGGSKSASNNDAWAPTMPCANETEQGGEHSGGDPGDEGDDSKAPSTNSSDTLSTFPSTSPSDARNSITYDIFTLQEMSENSLPAVARQSSGTCQLNENGFYGSPIGTVYQVSYPYQVVVRNGTTETMVKDIVAPALDVAIAQALLPYFFPQCTSRRQLEVRSSIRVLQSTAPTINGVSRLESDFPVSGDRCVGSAALLTCYVFNGFVSVFTENVYSQTQADGLVTPALQLVFQGSALTNVNLLVEQVQYLGSGLVTVAPVETPSPVTRWPTRPPAPTNQPLVPTTGRPLTQWPTSPPVLPTTGAPNGVPTTPAPVPAQPSTAAPNNNVGTPAPSSARPVTLRPTGPTPVPQPSSSPAPTPSVETIPPIPISTPSPSRATPVGTAKPTVQNRSASGAAQVQWWGWLLVGIGAALILLCCYGYFGRAGNGDGRPASASGKGRSDGAGIDDGDDDAGYVPPGSAGGGGMGALGDHGYEPPGSSAGNHAYEPPPDIDYQPPLGSSGGAAAIAAAAAASYGGVGAREQSPPSPSMDDAPQTPSQTTSHQEDDYGYEDDQGDEEFEDDGGEYYEEGEEYEEGDEEYEEQEQEGSYEEQSYYEEETVGRDDENQPGGWGRGNYGGGGGGSY